MWPSREARGRWHITLVIVLVSSQIIGTFLPRASFPLMGNVLRIMQHLTGASGQFLFFAGPLTSRLTRHYGNVEVETSKEGHLHTERLSAGQSQQLRVYLLAPSSDAIRSASLDRMARFVLERDKDIDGLTLRLLHRDARRIPLQTQVTLVRTYAVPPR